MIYSDRRNNHLEINFQIFFIYISFLPSKKKQLNVFILVYLNKIFKILLLITIIVARMEHFKNGYETSIILM